VETSSPYKPGIDPLSITHQLEVVIGVMLGRKAAVCSCDGCRSMCKNSPCLPTPEEALRIMDAGYVKEMVLTTVMVPGETINSEVGYECIMPEAVKDTSSPTNERCVFLDHRDLCVLHDKGLKPVEGRFAICGTTELDSIKLRYMVARTWTDTALGKKIVDIASASIKNSING
jgi:hypothetical protein